NRNLEDLLKLPRQPKGDKQIGIKYNNYVPSKPQQHFEVKEINLSSLVTAKNIDDLIKSNTVCIFVDAIYHQTDIDETRKYDGFYTSVGVFKEGKLEMIVNAKEYWCASDEFDYSSTVKISSTVKTFGDYK